MKDFNGKKNCINTRISPSNVYENNEFNSNLCMDVNYIYIIELGYWIGTRRSN